MRKGAICMNVWNCWKEEHGVSTKGSRVGGEVRCLASAVNKPASWWSGVEAIAEGLWSVDRRGGREGGTCGGGGRCERASRPSGRLTCIHPSDCCCGFFSHTMGYGMVPNRDALTTAHNPPAGSFS